MKKIILGIDFDNTIVKYDKLFHTIAVEYDYIEEKVEKTKIAVRDTMNSKGLRREFTRLQGEVYGKKIMMAEIAENLRPCLQELDSKHIKVVIISHKTRHPIEGPKYDLRKAATNWLRANSIINNAKIGITEKDVYFANTKEEKAQIIKELGCDLFVDDLIEILRMLPATCKKIHYSDKKTEESSIINMQDWKDLQKIIGIHNGY